MMVETREASVADPFAVRNRTFDEIAVGDEAALQRTLTTQDIQLFAAVSGDVNPQHLDPDFAATTRFDGVVAHGMWTASLFSALLGTQLPGPGTIYVGQSLRFLRPVRVGDTVSANVRVESRNEATHRVTFACRCTNQDGETVVDGTAEVVAPTETIVRPRAALPQIRLLERGDAWHLQRARKLGPIRVAVVHPCDESSLAAALDARAAGLIDPVLVAPRAKLEAVAERARLELPDVPIEDVPHSHAAAARAVELAACGKVDAVMKGSLHTDELMSAAVARQSGLRTERRMSHCYLMQSPAYQRPFIVTDGAINIAPTLCDKADIVRNAIDLARAVGVGEPRVAILAAVETVDARMPATLDAAALCKMSDRGQIAGAVVDGPLGFDNAVSAAAARIKGIDSPVAGAADILVVPDLESGNLLVKQLEYLGGAASAGIVMGARVPIILTSRADSRETRLASCAIAVILVRGRGARP